MSKRWPSRGAYGPAMRKPYSMFSKSSPNTTIENTLPMRNSSGNGISTSGAGACLSNSTSVHAVALREKIEKLTPPGTRVAPNGSGRPGRSFQPSWSWVAWLSMRSTSSTI